MEHVRTAHGVRDAGNAARMIADGLGDIIENALTPGFREDCMAVLGARDLSDAKEILFKCVLAQLDLNSSAKRAQLSSAQPCDVPRRIFPGSTLDVTLESIVAAEDRPSETPQELSDVDECN